MNFNSENDVRSGKRLGSGTFGSVYQHGDYAIKIYHDYEKNAFGGSNRNSCLDKEKNAKLLIKKGSKIKNTDLIIDLLYINGIFKGVCYPYQESETLAKAISSTTFEQKIDLSRQLIKNTKELNKYFIYPLDSKLNNILYDGEKIKIIDLDDILTITSHFYNPILLKTSLYSLKKTLIDIFDGDQYLFGYNVLNLIDSYREYDYFRNSLITTYKSLNKFLDNKMIEKKLLFINYNDILNLNIENLKKLVAFTDCKIILMILDKQNYLEKNEIDNLINTIKNLELIGIQIYDIIFQKKDISKEEKIIQSVNNYNTSGYCIIDNQNIFNEHRILENDSLDFYIDKLNCKTKKR